MSFGPLDKQNLPLGQGDEYYVGGIEPIVVIEGVIDVQKDEGGRFWVKQMDLTNKGVYSSHLGSFRVLELNGVLFEIQGWHEGQRRWWIERVIPVEEAKSEA